MVYFGERRFKRTRSGPGTTEAFRILVPILALGGLTLVILSQVRSSADHRNSLPATTYRVDDTSSSAQGSPTSNDPPPGDSNPPPGDSNERPAGIIEVAPPPGHREPDPFTPNDALLESVRDGSVDAAGRVINERLPSESAGIAYLFHRFRSGLPVPNSPSLPSWPEDYQTRGSDLRGRRCVLNLEVLQEPEFHSLDPGPSGVEHYYSAFGLDSDQHYHRIVFAEQDGHLGANSRIRVTADYLRLHTYVDVENRTPSVPMWVAYRVEKAPPRDVAPQWDPVVWVSVIGGFGVLVVWVTMTLNRGMRRTPRRTFSRRPRAE